MRRIDRVLGEAVAAKEVLRTARAQRAMARWREVVGPVLAERSHPDRYSRGTVFIAVQSSAWAQELRLRKPQIIERLNSLAGERGLFEDARFGVRPLPSVEEAPPDPSADLPMDPPQTIREIADKWLRRWTDEDRA